MFKIEQFTPKDDTHNPDINPNWKPMIGRRIYQCKGCGTQAEITTNHTGTVWAEPCHGHCKDIINPHTEYEQVIWHPARPHSYVKEAK